MYYMYISMYIFYMMINTAMTGINVDDACEAYNIVVYWP